MYKSVKRNFIITGILLALFIILIVLVLTVDVKPIGPNNSSIGLATINDFVFKSLGENVILFHITDWLGVVAISVAMAFGILGLVQLIKRKSIKKVDLQILLLGAFYIITALSYILFEFVVINYRPVILDGSLEASFPSSTTLVTVTIMGSAMILLQHYLKAKRALLITLNSATAIFIAFTVIGRQLSGVHWFTDIVSGILLSGFLIMLYYSCLKYFECKLKTKIV